jgi:hypothetical protein
LQGFRAARAFADMKRISGFAMAACLILTCSCNNSGIRDAVSLPYCSLHALDTRYVTHAESLTIDELDATIYIPWNL